MFHENILEIHSVYWTDKFHGLVISGLVIMFRRHKQIPWRREWNPLGQDGPDERSQGDR